MQKALTILALLETHLPEIKQALGERWAAFADQLQAQATLFAALNQALAVVDEAALPELSEALDNSA